MAILQDPTTPTSGGYAAHNERSKAAFLRNGQDILETFGLNATTQQIKSVTGVSPSTLYRYFRSREAYLAESFESIWTPWIKGFLDQASKYDDELIAMVFPVRMVLTMNQTNPKLAAIISHKDFRSEEMYLEVSEDWVRHFQSLIEAGVLPNDRAEARLLVFTGSLMFLVRNVVHGLGSEVSDAGLKLALSTLGLSQSQIDKVMQVPLPLQ
jgi:AcrR family transcriptional regulator